MAKTNEVLEITIHNVENGEIITRPLNEEELAQVEIDKANAAALTAEKEKAAADKTALLTRLGITAEEAKLLLS